MSNYAGYNGKMVWIDLTQKSFYLEEKEEEFWRIYIGGGLLATHLLLKHVPPGLDALDAQNLLIFTSSVVAGHPYPGLARFTTACKSPLTNGIAETRTEGNWGALLKKSGVDTIIIL